mmetsp:Transcript_8998/g.10809  ORF Transcript_8998/g.10809 Transcript_8998/m.10809 type:complete len:98 (+) Transcript_8998:10686-10979(+)
MIPRMIEKTPLSDSKNCFYKEDQFLVKELNHHGNSRAFFTAHSRPVDVWVRNCSCYHMECRYHFIDDKFHRVSRATMVANEVPLLYWKLTKTMRGSL